MDYDKKIVSKLISYRRIMSVVPTKAAPRLSGNAIVFSRSGVSTGFIGRNLRSLILGKVANYEPNLVLPGLSKEEIGCKGVTQDKDFL